MTIPAPSVGVVGLNIRISHSRFSASCFLSSSSVLFARLSLAYSCPPRRTGSPFISVVVCT